jgi:rhodanese-related sulfurtransferase
MTLSILSAQTSEFRVRTQKFLKVGSLMTAYDSASQSSTTTSLRRNSKYPSIEVCKADDFERNNLSRSLSPIYRNQAKQMKQLCLLPLLLVLIFCSFYLDAASIRGTGNAYRRCKEIDTECFRRKIERALLSDTKAIVIDARQQQDILESNKFYRTPKTAQWINVPCMPSKTEASCPLLNVAWEYILPDKSIPIIVYCASGKRAGLLKTFLEDKGYLEVYNAGGIGKADFLLPPVVALES